MVLHTFNKAQALYTFGQFVQKGDSVIFLEDGVYCLLDDDLDLGTENILVIEADVLARGLDTRISKSVRRIDYQGFVEICAEANSISNWF
jgi:tRNA 2-thiouridine synthesizing protein B